MRVSMLMPGSVQTGFGGRVESAGAKLAPPGRRSGRRGAPHVELSGTGPRKPHRDAPQSARVVKSPDAIPLEGVGRHRPRGRSGASVTELGARIMLKLENENPTGSMKDRMALAMIRGSPDGTDGWPMEPRPVVEYTGGSTGVSLAFVCAPSKGRPLHIVTSDAFSRKRSWTTWPPWAPRWMCCPAKVGA